MIKREKLYYINKPAIDAPYPTDDYAYDTINQISYALALFRRKYEGKKYSLLLSNNQEIVFEIEKKNLAHLLGVDYKNITTNPLIKPLLNSVLGFNKNEVIDSYMLLEKIVENADKVIEHDENHDNKIMNYYRIMIKTMCFNKLSNFDKFDFGIINFNRKTYENSINRNFLPSSNKFLLIPTDEEEMPFYLFGLLKEKDSNVMVPETIIAPINFYNYIYKQEFLLPEELIIDDKDSSSVLLPTKKDKLQLLYLYRSIIETYNTNSTVETKIKK